MMRRDAQQRREPGFPAGVYPLDHTADIGMRVTAPDAHTLFQRAALGMLAFLRPDPAAPAGAATGPASPAAAAASSVMLELEADDPALLLAAWLRELLFLAQVRGQCYAGAAFPLLEPTRLRAQVALAPCAAAALQEIKGVTYHALELKETGDGWQASVIFDV